MVALRSGINSLINTILLQSFEPRSAVEGRTAVVCVQELLWFRATKTCELF